MVWTEAWPRAAHLPPAPGGETTTKGWPSGVTSYRYAGPGNCRTGQRGLGFSISTALASHLETMIFGALIVFFLIVEPHGLARLWSTAKEKLRLWPFPH